MAKTTKNAFALEFTSFYLLSVFLILWYAVQFCSIPVQVVLAF